MLDRTCLAAVVLMAVVSSAFGGDPLAAHAVGIHSLAFGKDDQSLVTGGADGIVKRWNVSRPTQHTVLVANLDRTARAVETLVYDDTTKSLWVGRSHGMVEQIGWDDRATRLRFQHETPASIVGIGLRKNSSLLATGLWAKQPGDAVVIGSDGRSQEVLEVGAAGTTAFAQLDEDQFLFGSILGIRRWSVSKGKLGFLTQKSVSAMAVEATAGRVWAATHDGDLLSIKLSGGTAVRIHHSVEPYVALATSGQKLWAAHGHHLDVFNLTEPPALERTLNCPADILSLAAAPNGKRIAVGFDDGAAWVIESGGVRIQLVDSQASAKRVKDLESVANLRQEVAARDEEHRFARGAYFKNKADQERFARAAAAEAWAKQQEENFLMREAQQAGAIKTCGRCGRVVRLNATGCPTCGPFTGTIYR